MKKSELITALRFALPGTERLAGGGMDRVLFDTEWVRSYNENISVSYPFKTDTEIAVRAEEFYKILTKMPGEEVDFRVDEEKRLIISSPSKKTKLKLLSLPVEDYQKLRANILSLKVDDWLPLPKGFSIGLPLSLMSGMRDSRLGKIAGVGFKSKAIVSTDNYKVSYYEMESGITDELFRLRLSAVESLVKLQKEFESVAINKMWLHLKAKDGIVVSVRILPTAEYPISDILGVFQKYEDTETTKTYEFPKGLEEALSRVAVLAYEGDEDFKTLVNFTKEEGDLVLRSHQSFGEIEDRIAWDGELPEGGFSASPAWLKRILRETKKFKVSTDRKTLLFEAPNFKYLMLTKVGK